MAPMVGEVVFVATNVLLSATEMAGEGVSIEPITRQNVLAFKAVRLCALQDAPTAFSSTYASESRSTDEDWLQRADRWNGDRSRSFVARDSDIPCGIVGSFLDTDDPRQAHLVAMWVAPSHRRTGVGRALVHAVLDGARSKNAQAVYLMVTSNNDTAITFYRSLGFSFTGGTEPYRNDPELLEQAMRCRI
jgi:ribosomal protein S18 acetylase RimI-like enzyme